LRNDFDVVWRCRHLRFPVAWKFLSDVRLRRLGRRKATPAAIRRKPREPLRQVRPAGMSNNAHLKLNYYFALQSSPVQ
jgi:hypothetical protein